MAIYQVNNLDSPINFGSTDTDRILQNVKNLIMCRMGEVPYDRYRGFDQSLFDLPEQKIREELIPELDRCLMWEPRAEIVDAKIELLNNTAAYITVDVEIAE